MIELYKIVCSEARVKPLNSPDMATNGAELGELLPRDVTLDGGFALQVVEQGVATKVPEMDGRGFGRPWTNESIDRRGSGRPRIDDGRSFGRPWTEKEER